MDDVVVGVAHEGDDLFGKRLEGDFTLVANVNGQE